MECEGKIGNLDPVILHQLWIAERLSWRVWEEVLELWSLVRISSAKETRRVLGWVGISAAYTSITT